MTPEPPDESLSLDPTTIVEEVAAMQQFLLIPDHKKRKVLSAQQFDTSETEDAITVYQEAEIENLNNRNWEIVLIGADSIDVIRKTHGHYFGSSDTISKYLSHVS
jgi:predicted Zn-dependent protease with MMP-like domain